MIGPPTGASRPFEFRPMTKPNTLAPRSEAAAGISQRTFRCFSGTPPGGSLGSFRVSKYGHGFRAAGGIDSSLPE
jgi:hypothetical protein